MITTSVTVTEVKNGEKGEDGKSTYLHRAFAWSSDGTDGFTLNYPNENLLVKKDGIDNFMVSTDGNFVPYNNTTLMKDFIPVKEGEIYYFSQILTTPIEGDNFFRYAFYDEVGNTLQRFSNANLRFSQTVPFNAVEMRVSYQKNNKPKIEKSKSPTIYTPSPKDDYENAYPKYKGEYTSFDPIASANPSDYKWMPWLGQKGEDGKPGEPGKPGENGTTPKDVVSGYLTNQTLIVPANPSGVVSDYSNAYGDFVVYEGQTKITSGVTYSKVSEIGMTSTINSAGRYTMTVLTTDTAMAIYRATYNGVSIEKNVIANKNKQGITGNNGVGVSSTTITYQVGSSGTTTPTGTWSSTIPTVAENQYLWTRTVTTYTDSTSSTGYSVSKMGGKGETGNGVATTTVNYASSTSGTVTPTTGWTTTIPTVADGSFLWTRTVLTFANNTTSTSYSVSKNGTNGIGISSTVITYQASTSGTTIPTGTWVTTIPTVAENQYLWTRTVLSYTNSSTATGYSVSKMGGKGATGVGVTGSVTTYSSSTSATTPPTSWTSSIPTVAEGSYLWTRTVLTFSDNTTNISYSVAKQGAKGDPTGVTTQATIPTSPYVGMLWQNTGAIVGYITGATYQWNGLKWNPFILMATNILAETLSAITANLGTITTGTINGAVFISEFDREQWSGGALTRKGQIEISQGILRLDYEEINKANNNEVLGKGSYSIDENGYASVRKSATDVILNAVEYASDGIYMEDANMPYGKVDLKYQDLMNLPQVIITNTASGFSPYATVVGSTSTPTAERTMRQVQLSGAFTNSATFTGERTMATLPVGYRPSSIVGGGRSQASGTNSHFVTVYPDGRITTDRYSGTVPAGAWLKIDMTFTAGDI